MTAGVLDDEREQCLAAGMDDFVSKPIRSEELAAALGRLRPASVVALEQLRESVGEETTDAIVETFLAEAPALVARLRQSVSDGDAAGLRLAAHTLKSNANTFGGAALRRSARSSSASGRQAPSTARQSWSSAPRPSYGAA